MEGTSCLGRVVLVGVLFLTHALTSGLGLSFGVFYLPLMDTFESSNSFTAWIGSINLAMLCWLGPVAGIIINKSGCRLALMLGGLISAIGLLATYFATNIYFVFVTFGIVTGAGYGLTFTTAVVIVNIYFTKNRPIMMGLSIAGVSVGCFINPMINQVMIEHYSWRGSLLIFSALSLHVCGFALLFNKAPNIQQPVSKDYIAPVQRNKGLCSLDGIILILNCLLNTFGMTTVMTYVSPLAYVRGHSLQVSALVLSSLGLANLIGRILLGVICNFKHVDVVLVYLFSYVIAGLAAMFLPFWYSLTPLIIGSVIFGLFSAACGPVLSEVTLHVFGLSKFANTYGFLLVFMGMGFTVGGPASGFLLEQTGVYAHVFLLGGGTYILSGLIMCAIKFNHCHPKEASVRAYEISELAISTV